MRTVPELVSRVFCWQTGTRHAYHNLSQLRVQQVAEHAGDDPAERRRR